MTWTNRLILMILIHSLGQSAHISVRDSYDILKNSTIPIHATPHMNNMIRNGIDGLEEHEIAQLNQIGLQVRENSVTALNPVLDQTHDMNHFRFFYANCTN